MDLGFEEAQFEVGLAFDRNADSILSYNKNRAKHAGHVRDLSKPLSLRAMDKHYGKMFQPIGIIGGPPCQSFSQANVNQISDDPRSVLPFAFGRIAQRLNARASVDFFVLENVMGLTQARHQTTLKSIKALFSSSGFEVSQEILDAQHYGAPQSRKRVFLVGFNRAKFGKLAWQPPAPCTDRLKTVRDTIFGLPEPRMFTRGAVPEEFPHHPNHWCMQPKSKKFSTPDALAARASKGRSFKTLSWDRPSMAVAYGHREVHIHPAGHRRLSVYEAMRIQGLPHDYRLYGNLSSQFRQVSEAVPVQLASAVARSVRNQIGL